MFTSEERKALGEATHHEVFGGTNPIPPDVGPFWAQVRDQLFAEVWARDVMSIRDRRLMLLGALVMSGEEMPFELHARAALARGELNTDELREVLMFLVSYCSYPKTSKLVPVVERLVREHNA